MIEAENINTLVDEVKAIAVRYYKKTGKPLGVTGEIAELEAAKLLGLTLAAAREPGYDAVRENGEKVQIKGRWKANGTGFGRVSSINTTKPFDTVVLVLMHKEYEVLEILEASRSAVTQRLDEPGSKARNERRSMDVSQFRSIAKQVWP